jgi:mRNA-degrading endonuclease RelE of RelBE toxin-antitoxin system
VSLRVEWAKQALKNTRRLDRAARERILQALDRLSEAGQGDLIRLRRPLSGYRLRVGEWRVLLDMDKAAGTILVRDVLPRGRAYERD